MISRSNVLWFGEAPSPSATREFSNRRLDVVVLAGRPTLAQLIGARGAVFALSGKNVAMVGPLLRGAAHELADHGLFVCVGIPDEALLAELDGLDLLDERWALRREAPADHEFAEAIARHDPGPSYNQSLELRYASNIEPLAREDELLVRRAFSHCGSIILDEMGGGLSNARVFSADTAAGNSKGSWTQPFFVKIDRAEKIATEAAKYREAASFIPFGLRPNLETELYGARRAVLVGNLVDKSESLWDVARRGQADAAIFNLFNTTLAGWRRLGLRNAPEQRPLLPALVEAGIVDKARIDQNYVSSARSQGAGSLDSLWAILSGLDQCHCAGPIHGDLHAENVRVRGTDAILIDLALARSSAPIVIDLALLEVWLAFAVHRDDDGRDLYEDPDWRAVVDELYVDAAFDHPPPPTSATEKWRWLRDSVRHIRIQAFATQTCPSEYRTAVIVALLRLCMFPSTCRAEKFRRTVGYLLASRLTESLAVQADRHAA